MIYRHKEMQTFSFNYHMFGSNDMGSLTLEASNDNGG